MSWSQDNIVMVGRVREPTNVKMTRDKPAVDVRSLGCIDAQLFVYLLKMLQTHSDSGRPSASAGVHSIQKTSAAMTKLLLLLLCGEERRLVKIGRTGTGQRPCSPQDLRDSNRL